MEGIGYDSARPACEPYCDLPDGADMALCDECGAMWVIRQVTEVDPVTFQPTRMQHSWTRL